MPAACLFNHCELGRRSLRFLAPNRNEHLDGFIKKEDNGIEPDDGKLSCSVLRGERAAMRLATEYVQPSTKPRSLCVMRCD